MKRKYVGNVIMCRFHTGEEKAYFATGKIRPGNKVIIETAKRRLKVVEVSRTEDLTEKEKKTAEKWIVQRVSLKSYLKKQAEEKALTRI